MGLVWCCFGLVFMYFAENIKLLDYGYLFLGLAYFGLFFYEKHHQYFTIENGLLKHHALLGNKQINLEEIIQIKKFAGEYILKTNNTQFTIVPKIIEPDSLKLLMKELESLNVEWI